MAFKWRIRHKLMLGLGLVVSIIALLLAGTLYGLAKFRITLKCIDSKQAELAEAQQFKMAVYDVKNAAERSENAGALNDLLEKVPGAATALDAYEARLNETLKRGRDPDQGFEEKELVDALHGDLDKLITAVKVEKLGASASALSATQTLMDNDSIRDAIGALLRNSGDLSAEINKDLANRSRDAKDTFRTSLWIIFSTSNGGVLLMCGLLRFFYRWVFFPIRDLEEGAGRVAQGDFEHRIEVHSGDEMEDLAKAFNDMTGRLREMYRDLARQVNDRSRQLVRSERLASVGFLAAGVAHEINNPLASIAFCSEALESRLSQFLAQHPRDSETITKYLKMIQQEAFRCKAITQRLLEFSRGGERRRELTDLVELIQSVLDVVQHLQNGKGKHVIFEPTQRVNASINGQEIKSVILNLVVNALDSMDEGGTLTIELGERDQMAELVFADSGCGMSADILENIFEPFYTRSRTGKGTGLGLSISHRVISQHGGEIEAASPGPNRGSTFTVRLPLQLAEQNKEETFGNLAA